MKVDSIDLQICVGVEKNIVLDTQANLMHLKNSFVRNLEQQISKNKVLKERLSMF